VRFFHFLNSNSNLESGPVGNRAEPVRPVPTVSGLVPTCSVNPGHDTYEKGYQLWISWDLHGLHQLQNVRAQIPSQESKQSYLLPD
jgi:hypothetical protein